MKSKCLMICSLFLSINAFAMNLGKPTLLFNQGNHFIDGIKVAESKNSSPGTIYVLNTKNFNFHNPQGYRMEMTHNENLATVCNTLIRLENGLWGCISPYIHPAPGNYYTEINSTLEMQKKINTAKSAAIESANNTLAKEVQNLDAKDAKLQRAIDRNFAMQSEIDHRLEILEATVKQLMEENRRLRSNQ